MLPTLAAALALVSPAWPQTRAEISGYTETSTYAETMAFMNQLVKMGAPIQLRTVGQSPEGRPIPLAIMAHPMVENAAQARRQGKLIVYLQANIHAGEVEGKEATLMIMRRISQQVRAGRPNLLNHMVILVNPIYNADGNEKFASQSVNRPGQDGPERVGTRANAQGFDLNRDCIKAASPEMRAALDSVYVPWDPDVTLDLHTTNGTRHGYELTYAPPTLPTMPEALLAYNRDVLMPGVRAQLKADRGWELFDYGNAVTRNNQMVWETFGYEARYVTNYVALRRSIGILSEAISFHNFRDRTVATDGFVTACLERVARDRALIQRLRRPAPLPAEMGVRFNLAVGRTEPVLLEKLAPGQARPATGRPAAIEAITMPVYDRFTTVRTARVPAAYYLPGRYLSAIRLMRRHGLTVEPIASPINQTVESFAISEFRQAARPFQGVRLITLEGTFARQTRTIPAGWVRVPVTPETGHLAFHLLEPEGTDGLVTWGFLGEPGQGTEFPVLKAMP